ncbi:hypothetical protein PALA5_02494 [Pseudomonas aeruginosa]|nr:hypothetical protein [Pseudomonas aeruginosa]
MNSGLSRLGIALLAAMFAPALLAADLEKLDVAALPGDRVELKLQFDEPVAAPRIPSSSRRESPSICRGCRTSSAPRTAS